MNIKCNKCGNSFEPLQTETTCLFYLTPNQTTELDKAINHVRERLMPYSDMTTFEFEKIVNRLKEVEKERDDESKAYKDAIEILKEKYQELSQLRTEYKNALNGVDVLASVCTCARPAVPTPEGGVKAPGPHTAKCVHSIANRILSTPLAIATMKGEV